MATELINKLKKLQKMLIERNNIEFKNTAVELINPARVDEEEATVEPAPVAEVPVDVEEIKKEVMELAKVEAAIREAIGHEQETIAEYIKKAAKCQMHGYEPLAKLFQELAADEAIHASSLVTALDMYNMLDYRTEVQGHQEAINIMVAEDMNEIEKKAAELEKEADKVRREFDFVEEYTRNKAEYDKEKVVNSINDVILGKSTVDDMLANIGKNCKKAVSDKKDTKNAPKTSKSEKKSQKEEKSEEKVKKSSKKEEK